ncbi:hypothetical protein HHI36_005526 [Cryptolaemus montrouzieri]|uniref:Uncharacterized protein n=1 Tax=Cryptolaemus montrouzieri TaxID=559131 RepID=A0ABD2NUZ5_9CUCU
MTVKDKWEFVDKLSVKSAFEAFVEVIQGHLNQFCSASDRIVEVSRKHKRWITPDIVSESKELRYMHWLLTAYPVLKAEYSSRKNQHEKSIPLAKQRNFFGKINSSFNKCNEIWKIVRQQLNEDTGSRDLKLVLNGYMVTNRETIADAFVEHFSNMEDALLFNHFGMNLSLPPTCQELNFETIFVHPLAEAMVFDDIAE